LEGHKGNTSLYFYVLAVPVEAFVSKHPRRQAHIPDSRQVGRKSCIDRCYRRQSYEQGRRLDRQNGEEFFNCGLMALCSSEALNVALGVYGFAVFIGRQIVTQI
jgi:hypothetical protein